MRRPANQPKKKRRAVMPWFTDKFRGNGKNVKDLADELYGEGKRAVNDFPGGKVKYWPRSIIAAMITEDAVKHELHSVRKQLKKGLVRFIVDDAKKLFTLAVIVTLGGGKSDQLLKVMKFFFNNNISDTKVSPEIADITRVHGSPTSTHQTTSYLDQKMLAHLDHPALRSKLLDEQWKVFVPVLSTAKAIYSFSGSTILPFKLVEMPHEKHGGFSKVHQVKIQSGHIEDPGRPGSTLPKSFAVKEILPPSQEERGKVAQMFSNEAERLKEMNESGNKHILRFITAFTKGDHPQNRSYYLLFEWADGGSLEDLFEQHPSPVLNGEIVRLMVDQIQGLAGAIKKTHDAQIRHGDLKPPNILRFRPTNANIIGTLKIGDWGLAKYHVDGTALREKNQVDTTTNYFTHFYEPPEVMVRSKGRLLGRQYDVWSIGCIILEIIIWLCYGLEGVKQFRRDVAGPSSEPSPCYEIVPESQTESGKRMARVRPIVVEWMGHMAKQPAYDEETALGVLLKLVKDHLLVTELPPEYGNTVYEKDNATQLTQRNATKKLPVPEFNMEVTPPKVVEDDPSIKKLSKTTRATSETFINLLQKEMDAEDRSEDFWFRSGPTMSIPRFGRRSSISPGPSTSSSSSLLDLPSSGESGRKHRFVSIKCP